MARVVPTHEVLPRSPLRDRVGSQSLSDPKNADEYFTLLGGGEPITEADAEDATVAIVADEIEATTEDFIIKRLAKDLKGFALEEFVSEIFATIGYRTRVTQKSGDKGVDVIAPRDELGIEPPIIKIQVKSTEGTVGDPDVSQLFGKVASGEFGVLVTPPGLVF